MIEKAKWLVAGLLALILSVCMVGRVGSDIGINGPALQYLREHGWSRSVELNICQVIYDMPDDDPLGAYLVPNTCGSRGTVHMQVRYQAIPSWAAELLVHEAVHQMLFNRGIGYSTVEERRWQEWGAHLVQQVFVEDMGLFQNDVYRPPNRALDGE